MTKPHHAAPGRSDEWFTPPEIFEAMAVQFDLDPCQPEDGRSFLSVPASRYYTARQDGLTAPWGGFVWLNPPFGGRNGVVPWLRKFMAHRNGVCLVNALTSSGWFHDWAPYADAMLFPRGKTKFVRPDGSRGASPANGVVLLACGGEGVQALRNAQSNGLGMCLSGMKIPGPNTNNPTPAEYPTLRNPANMAKAAGSGEPRGLLTSA
ncbi:DNA N-6-adenine-methyltransferase [Acetobacter senegalensis]|uniref:DNA N-6-adenine-methyltransferase n=1 Tax=Acetobacter senegalensis TaxID=446692 RepID=UPI002652F6FE|nr:DNA N-6-adenine-methyltransferase [Acetobacter senegalensis]MDN7356341.1 DNA N-6-adenine-methyltransferase [Acetobacter senegalensis]